MANMLQRGQAMLNRAMKAAAGVPVVYTRDAGHSTEQRLPLVAEVGRTKAALSADGGTLLTYGERDYLIDFAALIPLGGPRETDRITEVINGEPVTFEMAEPDTREPAWRFSDATRTKYRIHTKKV